MSLTSFARTVSTHSWATSPTISKTTIEARSFLRVCNKICIRRNVAKLFISYGSIARDHWFDKGLSVHSTFWPDLFLSLQYSYNRSPIIAHRTSLLIGLPGCNLSDYRFYTPQKEEKYIPSSLHLEAFSISTFFLLTNLACGKG